MKTKEDKMKNEQQERSVRVTTNTSLLYDDIKSNMLKVVSKEPIVNAGSYPLALLWQIFEIASDHFEKWEQIEMLDDKIIENDFKIMFPKFINNYPDVMTLDV